MNEQAVRKIVQDMMQSSQYKVGGVAYHVHNNIDAPSVYLPYTIEVGTVAPTGVAKEGTLYINTAATTGTTRFYINTNGGTSWAYFTASA